MTQPADQKHESSLLGKTQWAWHLPGEMRDISIASGKLEVVLQQLQCRPLAVTLEALEAGDEQVQVFRSPRFCFEKEWMSLWTRHLLIVHRGRSTRSGAQEASIAREVGERAAERQERIKREIERERDLDRGFGIE
jgi:hypothetical protein